MANDITGMPLKLDTTGATSVVTKTIRISKIRWVAPTTVDHAVILKDGAGRVVFHATLTDIGTATNVIAGEPESDFNPPLEVTGLTLDTLGSGTVYVYYR